MPFNAGEYRRLNIPYAKELKELVQRLLARLGEDTTILYGSMARGDYGEWSPAFLARARRVLARLMEELGLVKEGRSWVTTRRPAAR